MKRAFIHPHFRPPALHNDIALVELARRIVYDYDKVSQEEIEIFTHQTRISVRRLSHLPGPDGQY